MLTLFILLATVNILHVVLILIVCGVGLYVINKIIPMEHWVKVVLNVVVAIVVFWLLLRMFGITGNVTV